jgi:LDH2 family malate/lactate/ureidoglycolate dehydrogenase
MTSQPERVRPDALGDFARRALMAAGMPEPDAAVTADALIWTDLRGLDGHGTSVKLPQCVARIQAGGTRSDPALPTLARRPATAALDGQNAWGQVAAVAGMRLAIAKAREHGVGAVSVRDVSSAAAMGYYPTLAIDEGLIGIAITNGTALIPAPGGTVRKLGNQAHAIGVPAGRHFPILFDSATTVMSTGEIDLYRERGQLLPDGVLLDAGGAPTREPADWKSGIMVPFGAHRGYALSLLFEVLTGVLAGSRQLGATVGSPSDHAQPQGVSLFLLAIDPESIMLRQEFTERVDRLIDRIHATPPATGGQPVYVPGERGYRTAQQRERDGIPLTAERAQTLRILADKLEIAAW